MKLGLGKVKLFYLRNEEKFPVACVASFERDGEILFAVSTHNKNDIYNKELGRGIAIKRLLFTDKSFTVPSGIGAKKRVLEIIAGFTDSDMPRAAEAAARMLSTYREPTSFDAQTYIPPDVAELAEEVSESELS